MRALLVMLWTVLAIGISGCAKPDPVELPPPKVGVATVLSVEIAREVRFPGRTVAPQRVELKPQVEGTIHKRFFADGQMVEHGDTLFQIDARSPEAALAQSRAELARAQVNAADAAKIADTNKKLYDQKVIGREEYQQSKAEADAAKALVRAQQAIVKSAALTRGFATIVAPFDGRIGEAEVDVGTFVAPGTARLAVIARLDPMYADFALSEREFLRLPGAQQRREEVRERPKEAPEPLAESAVAPNEGETPTDAADAEEPRQPMPDPADAVDDINERILVALQLADGSIHPYQGKLQLVSVEIDEATGTYPVRAIFPNGENILIPGLYSEVVIRRRNKDKAVLVPQTSLVLKQVGVIVYVLGDDGKLQQRKVKTGTRIGDLVQIESGVEDGEKIVTEGVHKCRDGLVVESVESEPLTLESDPLADEPREGPEGWYERFLAERRTATLVKG